MNICAALIATYFSGVQIADLDKTRVYQIPATAVARLTLVQRLEAKACAIRYGIKYKIT
jgi:hypothetical protein